MGTTTPSKPPSYAIVVGFDFSELAERALEEAIGIATRSGSHELHLVTVVEPTGGDGVLLPGDAEAVREDVAPAIVSERVGEIIRDYQSRGGAVGVDKIGIYVATGLLVAEIAAAIVDVARTTDAELVVLGAHGHTNEPRFALGSVAEYVVRDAACSVHVVRPREASRMEAQPRPAQPHPKHFARRHTYHYVDRVARWTHRTMPAS